MSKNKIGVVCGNYKINKELEYIFWDSERILDYFTDLETIKYVTRQILNQQEYDKYCEYITKI